MKQTLCRVISNVQVVAGVSLMWLDAPDLAATAQPGQFLAVRCADFTLRRPFSIHQVGSDNIVADPDSIETKQSQIALLFKVTGKGTLWLSQRKKGDTIDIVGPSGKGFVIKPNTRNLLLVAGGIGIAPLAFLVQQAWRQHRITLIQGAKTAAQLYTERCRLTAISYQGIQYVPVTEDGTMGRKGKATDILPDFLDWADQIYACGPVDMYETMAEMSLRVPMQSERSNLKLRKCQISLEVRMGCGFGACYGCSINTKKGVKRVCSDGPVFRLDDIIWQEVKI